MNGVSKSLQRDRPPRVDEGERGLEPKRFSDDHCCGVLHVDDGTAYIYEGAVDEIIVTAARGATQQTSLTRVDSQNESSERFYR